MKKSKILVPFITSTLALSTVTVVLGSCSCNNSKKPDVDSYDINISDEDKLGYITKTIKPYFEYYLTFQGLKAGNIIKSEITTSTAQKARIDELWLSHTITDKEVEEGTIKLKVVPFDDRPDQPVFSDVFSIKFTFVCEGEECFEKTIDDFVLDAAIATEQNYFNYETTNGEKIIKGFNRSYEQEIYECGVLVIPSDVTMIGENAFNPQIAGQEWYSDVYKNIKWLILDPTFEGIFPGTCVLKEIGASAFANCPLVETLYIPSTIKSIKSDAFNGCGFNHFEYMGNYRTGPTGDLTYIGYRAFRTCRFDGTLWLPKCDGFVRIYNETFACFPPFPGSKVKKLIIPSNVVKFDSNAFRSFEQLEIIDLSDYSTVPDPSGFSQYSFTTFSKQGKIYVKSAGLIEKWKDVLSQKNVFEDFVKGNWTIEVKP